jgi:hypothetical protein
MALSVAQLLKRVGTGLTAEIVIMKLLRVDARYEGDEREGAR